MHYETLRGRNEPSKKKILSPIVNEFCFHGYRFLTIAFGERQFRPPIRCRSNKIEYLEDDYPRSVRESSETSFAQQPGFTTRCWFTADVDIACDEKFRETRKFFSKSTFRCFRSVGNAQMYVVEPLFVCSPENPFKNVRVIVCGQWAFSTTDRFSW